MPRKFYHYSHLIRLTVPTGYLLVFFPAAFGVLLAASKLMDLLYIPILFIGAVLSRGAGCIINDLYDRNLDKRVERTKGRPLASGAVSVKEALILLFVMLVACLAILLSLSKTAIVVGFVAFFLILLYPLMKRLTYFPQTFLGITFNLGCLIGYAAVKDAIEMPAILAYVACAFWTLGYDTIYAFSDIKDDKKVGIKSTAIFFEKRNYRWWIKGFYIAFVTLFGIACIYVGYNISAVMMYFVYKMLIGQIQRMDIAKPEICMECFRHNNLVGTAVLIYMFLGILGYASKSVI